MVRIARSIPRWAKSEIDHAFAHARRMVKHPGLTILVAPQQAEHGRILIITPKKVGSAPERNKLRRQLKSIFYEEELYKKGLDCIVIFRKAAVGLPFAELKKMLISAFGQKS